MRRSFRITFFCASAFAAFAAFAGCQRETRDFQVVPAANARIGAERMTDLVPGPPVPNPRIENPYEENAWAVSEGQQLYEWYNCSGCHAHGGGDIGPPLMDHKWIYGDQPENIFSSIVEGRPNGMPAFRSTLTDEQVWKLTAYVRSLGGLPDQSVLPGRPDHMRSKDEGVPNYPEPSTSQKAEHP